MSIVENILLAGAMALNPLLEGHQVAPPSPNEDSGIHSGMQDPPPGEQYVHLGNCITGEPTGLSYEIYGIEVKLFQNKYATGGHGTEVGKGSKVNIEAQGNLLTNGHPAYATTYKNNSGQWVFHYCELLSGNVRDTRYDTKPIKGNGFKGGFTRKR